MSRTLHDHLSLPTLPTDRRLYALQRVRAQAVSHGVGGLLRIIDAGIQLDDEAWALERAWAARSTARPAGESADAIDRLIDARWGALHRMLGETAALHGAGTTAGDAAQAILDAAFEGGVTAIIRLTHDEQAIANRKALAALRSPDLADDVSLLRLGEVEAGLAALQDGFTAALVAAEADPALSWEAVTAARAAGREALARVVVHALAATDGQPEVRDAVLAPVWRQVDALRRSRRGRRTGTDIDPTSGDEVVEVDEVDEVDEVGETAAG